MKYTTQIESPIGALTLVSDGVALVGVYMESTRHEPEIDRGWTRDDSARPFPEARRQFGAYFAGDLREFDLPLAAAGTAFQKTVWGELQKIPYGSTISYGELARRVGNPNASRAVGLANGQNPLSIVIPCHRVIGANGKLVGYGGGLDRKKVLLELEGAVDRHNLFSAKEVAGIAPLQ